jgi:hypothetical protein
MPLCGAETNMFPKENVMIRPSYVGEDLNEISNNIVRQPSQKHVIGKLKKHINNISYLFNLYLEESGSAIRMLPKDTFDKVILDIDDTDIMLQYLEELSECEIYRSKIRTLIHITNALFRNFSEEEATRAKAEHRYPKFTSARSSIQNYTSVLAPMQWGKNLLNLILQRFIPVYSQLTFARPCFTIISIPNRLSFENQLALEDHVKTLCSLFVFTNGTTKICYEQIDRRVKRNFEAVSKKNGDMVDLNGLIRNSYYQEKQTKTYLRFLKESCNFAHIFVILDESHSANGLDSVLDRNFIKEFSNDEKFKFVTMSATNFESHATSLKGPIIDCWLDKDYVGPSKLASRRMNSFKEYKEALPHLISLKDLDCDSLNWDSYNSENTFHRHRTDKRETWYAYQKMMRRKISELITSVLKKGKFGRCEGMMLRVKTKDLADELARSLQITQRDVSVIVYHSGETISIDGNIRQSTKETIKKIIRLYAKKKYVILVVGAGRLGDQFPNSCRVFVDLTKKNTYLVSALQGTLGRACGWGKDTVVVVSEENKKLIQDYFRTGALPTNTAPRLTQLTDHNVSSVTVLARPNTSTAKDFQLLSEMCWKEFREAGFKRLRGNETNSLPYMKSRALERIMRDCESRNNITILRPDPRVLYAVSKGEDHNLITPDEAYSIVRPGTRWHGSKLWPTIGRKSEATASGKSNNVKNARSFDDEHRQNAVSHVFTLDYNTKNPKKFLTRIHFAMAKDNPQTSSDIDFAESHSFNAFGNKNVG